MDTMKEVFSPGEVVAVETSWGLINGILLGEHEGFIEVKIAERVIKCKIEDLREAVPEAETDSNDAAEETKASEPALASS